MSLNDIHIHICDIRFPIRWTQFLLLTYCWVKQIHSPIDEMENYSGTLDCVWTIKIPI